LVTTMSSLSETINRIFETYSKYIDEDLDIYSGNRYLTVAIETLIHEAWKNTISREELSREAASLRDRLVDGPGNLNPYVMELLGILEESTSDENLKEALDLCRRLLKEDRFEKLEV
jgi:predicted nuclease of restriction endonuclease-like (RecB) superfamily